MSVSLGSLKNKIGEAYVQHFDESYEYNMEVLKQAVNENLKDINLRISKLDELEKTLLDQLNDICQIAEKEREKHE